MVLFHLQFTSSSSVSETQEYMNRAKNGHRPRYTNILMNQPTGAVYQAN